MRDSIAFELSIGRQVQFEMADRTMINARPNADSY